MKVSGGLIDCGRAGGMKEEELVEVARYLYYEKSLLPLQRLLHAFTPAPRLPTSSQVCQVVAYSDDA